MKKLVKYFSFLILAIVCSCSVEAEGPPYGKYVDEIVGAFARDMRKQYGLICVGSGGQMPRNVETIGVYFYAYRKSSIEETRKLMIKAQENLVNRVNVHEKIRPYLKEYPFTWRGADISIAFHKPNSDAYYLDGSVAFVCFTKLGARIVYNAAELQTRELPGLIDQEGNILISSEIVEEEVFVDLFTETYEEALAIVNTSKK
jgi:hypothetical protein